MVFIVVGGCWVKGVLWCCWLEYGIGMKMGKDGSFLGDEII